MGGTPLDQAVSAARSFVAAKPAGDQLAVLTFGSKAVLLAGFSSSTTDSDAALRTIAVDSQCGTTLYDGVVRSADALREDGLPGRAIVLVTDGDERTSKATLTQAIAAARAPRAAVLRDCH